MQLFSRNEVELAKIRQEFEEGKLYVDRSYQRRKVWNLEDKVRLIETILLNYIVPPVFFWPAERDMETGIASTHIVDGQQRITTIVEFFNDEFALSKRFLTTGEIKNKYGDLKFSQLQSADKDKIWGYNLSVITIDQTCSYDVIKAMFYRLNLTDYSLNPQERRNSKDSVFGDKSKSLADLEFWNTVRVFSASDAKRMKDVEYCCSIYILANEFIVNQTDDKIVNAYYDDYAKHFDEDGKLFDKITVAMDYILVLKNKTTASFISKKAQLYTLFSVFIRIIEKNEDFDESFIVRFNAFVKAYSAYRNGFEYNDGNAKLANLFDQIKKYKLASSEGVNKIGNRMIRFETLFNLYYSDEDVANCFEELKECFEVQEAEKKELSEEEDDNNEE